MKLEVCYHDKMQKRLKATFNIRIVLNIVLTTFRSCSCACAFLCLRVNGHSLLNILVMTFDGHITLHYLSHKHTQSCLFPHHMHVLHLAYLPRLCGYDCYDLGGGLYLFIIMPVRYYCVLTIDTNKFSNLAGGALYLLLQQLYTS